MESRFIPEGSSETATLKAMKKDRELREMIQHLQLLRALAEGAILAIQMGMIRECEDSMKWDMQPGYFRLGPYTVKKDP